MREVVQGRSSVTIAEDWLIAILELPAYNVSRQDAVRYSEQRRSINEDVKEKALYLIDTQDNSNQWIENVRTLSLFCSLNKRGV